MSRSVASAWNRSRKQIAARNKMVEANLKLVHTVCNRVRQTCKENYEDLYQIGCVGLVKACDRFDPELGNAFSSFAVPYIQGEIQHYLRDQWQVVKVPRRCGELAAKVRRLKKTMAKLGREIDESAVAQAMGIEPSHWTWVQQATKSNLTASLDEMEFDPATPEVDTIDSDRERTWLYEALLELPDRWRGVVLERYMAGVEVEVIARRYGVTIETIHGWTTKALAELSEILNAKQDQDEECPSVA